jgi:hypothetical protein
MIMATGSNEEEHEKGTTSGTKLVVGIGQQ